MHEFVSFNQQIISAADIFLPAVSSAAFYGKGVFTTLAIYNKKPFLWEKHWERLTTNAVKIGVDLAGFSTEKVETSLLTVIERNNLKNARVRLTFFDESLRSVWQLESERKTSLLITAADLQPANSNLRLTVSPFRVNSASPLVGIKSCNYLENILALADAKNSGFDEAIRLNENGEVTSACMANVFWWNDEKLFTPHLKTGCLAGTTRSFLLEHFKVEEKTAALKELKTADEIFLTSAAIGIAQVKSFDGKVLGAENVYNLQKEFSRYCAAAA